MYLEPNDYRIYYVNINFRHQYGIFAPESQTFLRAKRPQRRRARRNGCFRRLAVLVWSVESDPEMRIELTVNSQMYFIFLRLKSLSAIEHFTARKRDLQSKENVKNIGK